MLTGVLLVIQFFFSAVIGIYFLNLLKSQQINKSALDREAKKELEKLKKLQSIKLTMPLAEKTRPADLKEILGQGNGLKALRAALCGPNPQHVIIYGPPGVGKTTAARIILEEAKRMPASPFNEYSKFIEVDAATLRFDERGIADPLIGSVHDPIYQGAGAYGAAGVPQPKPGAVTKAHGGILFIDEIGELHPVQMNKLLKVLEDRKVFLESAYYSSEDKNIPLYIHEIFQKGLPADFRLVAATTRSPEEIPASIRSRCIEIYFRALSPREIARIALNAAEKGGFIMESGGGELISRYARNGRDAVNIVQLAGSLAQVEERSTIFIKDIEWVVEFGHYDPRNDRKPGDAEQIGCVNGLAVANACYGSVIEIEASAVKAPEEKGTIKLTGIIEEEEMDSKGHKYRRTSTVKSSVDNVLTVLKNLLGIDCREYDIHLNFPGGIPIDGPSAGTAIAVVIYSAVKRIPVRSDIALTGEISIRGKVKPVGAVSAKIEAACMAGIKKVYIPKDNWQERYKDMEIEVIPVEDITQVFSSVFGSFGKTRHIILPETHNNIISASGINNLRCTGPI